MSIQKPQSNSKVSIDKLPNPNIRALEGQQNKSYRSSLRPWTTYAPLFLYLRSFESPAAPATSVSFPLNLDKDIHVPLLEVIECSLADVVEVETTQSEYVDNA